MYWLIIIAAIACCSFAYAFHINNYFKRRGLNYAKPVPFFGNFFKLFILKSHLNDICHEAFQNNPKDRYVGIFNFMTPVVLLKDIELIKQILIKDFDHFTDHMNLIDNTVDPYLGNTLVGLKGDKWKEMRNTLSPTFTSSKIKGMLPFISECGQKLVDHLESTLNSNEINEYDLRDLTSRFTNDVIASCTFGIPINSFADKNNDFFAAAKTMTQFPPILAMKVMFFLFFPRLSRFFKIQLINEKIMTYFHKIFISNMNTREKEKIIREDMVHLLMIAKKGALVEENNEESKIKKKTNWIDVELVAQAIIFIFAGFDTVSTVLCFMLYELALHPDAQNKLQNEIDLYMEECNGQIEYNNINKLKYLDMVLSETLRMWSPGLLLDRVCVKPYVLPPQNDESEVSHKLNVGDMVWISTFNIHRNPKYFKNPSKFDPERFSDENKSTLNTNAYLPFGLGPRICIGSRFALLEIKIFAILFLSKFEVNPSANTLIPMELKAHLNDFIPKTGHFLGIKKRIKN